MKGFSNLKLQSVLIFSRCKLTYNDAKFFPFKQTFLVSSLSRRAGGFSYSTRGKGRRRRHCRRPTRRHLAPRTLRRLAAVLYPQRLRLSSEEDRSSWSSFLADIAFSLISWLNAPAAVVATLEAEASHDPILYWLLPHWLPGWLAGCLVAAAAAPPSEDAATILVHSSNTAF